MDASEMMGSGFISQSFFSPEFLQLYGFHHYQRFVIYGYSGVFPIGYLIDEKVIIATQQIKMFAKSFISREKFFPIGQVSTYSHVREAKESKAEKTETSEVVVETDAALLPSFGFRESTVS